MLFQENYFFKQNRKAAETLKIEPAQKKILFPTVTPKFKKKARYRKFPFYG